ncbi:hypothetical protein NG819_14530 [Pseudarthrobacter sp. Fe7]|nr:hypothetical protein NG819_14530 [Pseudarthrobacter sp. Fe7]
MRRGPDPTSNLPVSPNKQGSATRNSRRLADPLELKAAGGFQLSPGSLATRWVDYLEQHDGTALAGYVHPQFGRYPAITTTAAGAGRITTIGTLPNTDLAADLIRWLAPVNNAGWEDLPGTVTIHSATSADGRRLHFVHNWGWEPVTIAAPASVDDLLDPEQNNLSKIELVAWDVRVLIETSRQEATS